MLIFFSINTAYSEPNYAPETQIAEGVLKGIVDTSKKAVDKSKEIEAKKQAEAEAKAKAEADAKAKADAEAKKKAEADAKAKAEAESKAQKAKTEADAKAQAEAKAKAEASCRNLNIAIELPKDELNALRCGGDTILTYAIQRYISLDTIGALLKAGADPNEVDANGRSAVFYAKDLSYLKILTKNGANLNLQDNDGNTPYYVFY